MAEPLLLKGTPIEGWYRVCADNSFRPIWCECWVDYRLAPQVRLDRVTSLWALYEAE